MSTEQRKPIFSAETEEQIMAQVVGRPSGVVVDLGGFAIDLVALPFAKDVRITTIAESIGALIDAALSGRKTAVQKAQALAASAAGDEPPTADPGYADVAPLIVGQYTEIKTLLRDIVQDSVDIDTNGGEAVFLRWFDALPMVTTIQTLLTAVLRANGLAKLGNVLDALWKAAPDATMVSPSLSAVPES